MAYVLDATAIIALAHNERNATQIVGDALENGKCYVTPPSLVAMYYYLIENDGQTGADHWLDYMISGQIVELEPCVDADVLRTAAKARLIVRLPLDSLFAAAVARRRDAQVITSLTGFEDLAQAKFCKVKWLG